ncbi:hypothetical protein C2I18_01015 [Paenibacillus sp. PK3_47]|nr:hypothetical protein C2I18_01015 [Paenibacillus sp. PK3_47]
MGFFVCFDLLRFKEGAVTRRKLRNTYYIEKVKRWSVDVMARIKELSRLFICSLLCLLLNVQAQDAKAADATMSNYILVDRGEVKQKQKIYL